MPPPRTNQAPYVLKELGVARYAVLPMWPLLLAPALLASQASPPCSASCLSQHAREALAAGRYRDYLNYARQIAAPASDHPRATYALARGHALVGQPAAALRW